MKFSNCCCTNCGQTTKINQYQPIPIQINYNIIILTKITLYQPNNSKILLYRTSQIFHPRQLCSSLCSCFMVVSFGKIPKIFLSSQVINLVLCKRLFSHSAVQEFRIRGTNANGTPGCRLMINKVAQNKLCNIDQPYFFNIQQ